MCASSIIKSIGIVKLFIIVKNVLIIPLIFCQIIMLNTFQILIIIMNELLKTSHNADL